MLTQIYFLRQFLLILVLIKLDNYFYIRISMFLFFCYPIYPHNCTFCSLSMVSSENNVFCIFVSVHLIFWTLIPTVTNYNLPLDTIEALAWGSNLSWGYAKHPPISAFMVEFIHSFFGSQDWSYYFLSQIFIIIKLK